MDTLVQDIRYALRALRQRPGFAAVVALTLAIGIGANSAIFSVVNGVLLRPLPYREPERLVMLWTMLPNFGREVSSLPDFRDWRGQSAAFSEVAALANSSFGISGEGEPERVDAAYVTADFFRTLGTTLAQGRSFTREEETPNSNLVIVSHGFWQRRLGGRAGILGETVALSGTMYTIVGVTPEGFRFGNDAQLWAPLNTVNPNAGRRSDFLTVIARLETGATIERAQAELTETMRRLEEQYPQTNTGVTAQVVSLHDELVGGVRLALLVFMGAVGLVLLIACANVANLLLARAAAREREMAVRAALGAGRARLVRQLLTESVVLGLAGAALGLLLAVWGVAALQRASPSNLPRIEAIAVDGRVIVFTIAVSLVIGVLFGLAPAIRLSQHALGGALRDGLRTVGGGGLRDLRGILVLGEVAVALLLLAGAGLLIRSFDKLQRVDVGVRPEGVVTAFMVPPSVTYPEMPQVTTFYDRLLNALRESPGARDVALVSEPPVSGRAGYTTFAIEGRPDFAPGNTPDLQPYVATESYFRTLGIPLVRGRTFTAQDRDGAAPVAVINEELARRHWPGQEPIGSRIAFGDTVFRTIVGIVGDTRQEGVSEAPYPQAYRAYAQVPRRAMYVTLRTGGDPLAAVGTLRQAVASIDREIALSDILTMEQRLGESVAQPRVNAALLTIFGLVALVLAAIGIYGVTSYAVAQRTREIGVRMALGARRSDVLRLVVRQGMLPVAAGLAVGIGAALAATRVLQNLLFGVDATDPITFVAITLLLGGTALVASLIPARRAAGVDPTVALRSE
ncbi:MAG: ABC transporter permease [Gemmatimonadota bacterium]|nr:ABC transporter permease [Gemmatimonadota bacterium]